MMRDEALLHTGTAHRDEAVTFECRGEQLFGIASLPAAGAAAPTRGVLVVVGGPQYRAGSHRQFTLLARALAQQGIPVLRFDYRGMGDSDGALRTFEDVNDDLRAGVDALCREVPTLREVIIWGLCDGATAAVMYAPADPRVTGLVLLNPWVRSVEGAARATLKHYYGRRLLDRALWTKIATGRFDYRAAAGSLLRIVRDALKPRPAAAAPAAGADAAPSGPLPDRMLHYAERFPGRVLLIISGNDLTAQEFTDATQASPRWRALLSGPRVSRQRLDPADHTFSRRAWRDQVAAWTAQWVNEQEPKQVTAP